MTLIYEYPDFLNSDGDFVEFDSYLVPESDLEEGALRMLSTSHNPNGNPNGNPMALSNIVEELSYYQPLRNWLQSSYDRVIAERVRINAPSRIVNLSDISINWDGGSNVCTDFPHKQAFISLVDQEQAFFVTRGLTKVSGITQLLDAY
jgi:hypothetical protein